MVKNPTHYLKVQRDAKGEYRWHLRARNGRIVADSGEGYKTASGCVTGFRSMYRAFMGDRIDFRDYNVVSDET